MERDLDVSAAARRLAVDRGHEGPARVRQVREAFGQALVGCGEAQSCPRSPAATLTFELPTAASGGPMRHAGQTSGSASASAYQTRAQSGRGHTRRLLLERL